jgi:hypothetical protein
MKCSEIASGRSSNSAGGDAEMRDGSSADDLQNSRPDRLVRAGTFRDSLNHVVPLRVVWHRAA